MWTRAELKNRAKKALSQNYWKLVLVALIANLVGNVTNSIEIKYEENNFSLDIFSGLVTYALGFAPVIVGTMLIVVVLGMVVEFFVLNPLDVGSKRFFIISHTEKAEMKELLYAFDNEYKNVVKILFIRDIKLILWTCLLVIPGIIKGLEYRMIPYLLAENPGLTQEEAFRLSKQMMEGQKWEAFVLDMSFIGWEFLSAFTLGILGIFYVSPYAHLTDAALYNELSEIHGHPARAAATQQEWREFYKQTEYEEI